MIDPRRERKMGARILATIAEIQSTPTDNVKRFVLLRKRLEKVVERYKAYTGRDNLDPLVDYGYTLK